MAVRHGICHSLSLSKHRTFATLRLGGGLEGRLTPKLTLRADYIFTDYGKLGVEGFLAGASEMRSNPITVSNSNSLHLYDHAVMLGLSYRFRPQAPLWLDPYYAAVAYTGFYFGGIYRGQRFDC